jgi:hypothetical protein
VPDEPGSTQDNPTTPDNDADLSCEPWRANSKRRSLAFAALISMSWVLTLFDRVLLLIVGLICYIVGALVYIYSLYPDKLAPGS